MALCWCLVAPRAVATHTNFLLSAATNAKATSLLCFGFGPASLSLQEEAESEHVLAIGRLIAKFHLISG
jgi:hypothetical protein